MLLPLFFSAFIAFFSLRILTRNEREHKYCWFVVSSSFLFHTRVCADTSTKIFDRGFFVLSLMKNKYTEGWTMGKGDHNRDSAPASIISCIDRGYCLGGIKMRLS